MVRPIEISFPLPKNPREIHPIREPFPRPFPKAQSALRGEKMQELPGIQGR